MCTRVWSFVSVIVLLMTLSVVRGDEKTNWQQADENGELARKTFLHCRDFVRGWLAHADPQTGLIPRNLTRDYYWNAKDAAADNYPFMVLTAALLDRNLFDGRLLTMLRTERRLTSRVGPMPDDYSFATHSFLNKEIDMRKIIFGASEYVKDGLLPLTEWLGPSPWRDRMVELVDAILDHAAIETPVGVLPAIDHEVGGEMMQTLSRLYWLTRNERYRTFAFRYADYFLLHALPTRGQKLSLDDHGCEVIGGLSEVYYLAAETDQKRHKKYKKPMYEMLDRILQVGRNENGLFYMLIDPVNGKVLNDELTDNWGYDYNAYLTVAEVDGYQPYRDAVRFVLQNVHKETGYPWERDSADGYADSIESGLNLLNRVPVDSGFQWVEHEIQHLLAKQRDDGVIEGWHGDGNYTRTALMYALWKTQGCHIEPWRADVSFGAIKQGDELWISIRSQWPWQGKMIFDKPRHRDYLRIPTDYARLNQFPEWFTVDRMATYKLTVSVDGKEKEYIVPGYELHKGFDVRTKGFRVKPKGKKPVRIKVRLQD